MSDEPKKPSRAGIGWALIAVLALYPLSFGPAAELGLAGDPESGSGFYKPMWAASDSGTFGGIIHAYLHFWYGLIGPCGRWPIRR